MLNCGAPKTARAKPPAEAAGPARATSDIPYPPLFFRIWSIVVYPTPLALHLAARGIAADRRVHLLTQQQRNRRKIEIGKQRDGGAEAPVDNAVVGEVRQVERKSHRSQCPRGHRENRTWHNEPNRPVSIGGKTVYEKHNEHEQEERNGDTKPRP